MSHLPRILLVDDAEQTHLILNEVFFNEASLSSVFNLSDASKIFEKEIFDLVLLDIMLPDGNGLEYFADLQKQPSFQNTPVIFLTGKSEFSAKSMGFNLGAEDYIVKPFNPEDVKLRCLSKVRKFQQFSKQPMQQTFGHLRLDLQAQLVFKKSTSGEIDLQLTPTEFKLLHFLSKNVDHVYSRSQIIEAVWGTGTHIIDRTVDTHLASLRKKIRETSVSIKAVHGQGYKLLVESYDSSPLKRVS